MLNNNPEKRPTIEQVYEDLMNIEFPLKNIGDTLADFEVVSGNENNKIVMYKKNYQYYCIMKYSNDKISIPIFQKFLYKQDKILKNLSHKNIIKYYGYLEDELLNNKQPGIKDYYLIYDYIPNGSLSMVMQNNNNELFPEDFIIKVFKQILKGLKYLHNENIAHGNIKPSSILFDSNYNVVISGFDYFGLYEDKHYTKNIINDERLFLNDHYKFGGLFTSPEMIKGLDWNNKADIFSLGLIITSLLSYPKSCQKLNFVNGILTREIFLNNINQKYNRGLVNLVSKMIVENPEFRPNAYFSCFWAYFPFSDFGKIFVNKEISMKILPT